MTQDHSAAAQKARGGEAGSPWWKIILSDNPANFLVAVSGWCGFVMMLAIVADVVARRFGHPIPGVFDLSEEFMMVLVFFPIASVCWRREHIFFSLTTGKLPPRLEHFLDGFASTVGATIFACLGYVGWTLAWGNFLIGEYRMGDVDIPVWPFRFVIAIGFLLSAAYLVALAFIDYRRAMRDN
jgi:TRAP-type C4-dicarboxylate transport system permease small subunit